LRILKNAVRKKENVSVGLVGNCADIIPELAERGVLPDILTDQTSAHDPLNGYVPNGMTLTEALALRNRDPDAYKERSLDAIARHVEAMLRLQKMGAITFDYGNNIRTFAFQRGVKNAYDFPGFVPEYIRPLFCEGRGPFRETESTKDGSDAVADWPLLNTLLNTAAGASWVSIHHGGGVGIGYSLHAGQVTVADGTEMMAKRIERVLTTDPGMGIIRHAD